MDKKQVVKVLSQVRKDSKTRNFKQSIDLIINLKDLDIKKTENQVEFFLTRHFGLGKQRKICALVGPELKEEAQRVCDTTIVMDDFDKYDLKAIKKLANEHAFFIAQANIMAKVAQTFGRVLGSRGKMPNPKAGCVVPPKTNLQALYDRLQKTVKISAKKSTIIQVPVGAEDMKEDELVDNIVVTYEQLVHHLPGHDNNIKNMKVKTTMGKPVQL